MIIDSIRLQDMHRRERQLREMLGQLRISAKSLVVPWDHVICHLNPSVAAGAQQQTQQQSQGQSIYAAGSIHHFCSASAGRKLKNGKYTCIFVFGFMYCRYSRGSDGRISASIRVHNGPE